MARKIPARRKTRPTNITGSTWVSCGRMFGVVLLPSMLKSTSCPKTQTPPMTVSTSRKTWSSATAAKHVPMTMTRSSGWKSEPALNPIGTSSLPASPAPMPKAQSATASTMRKLSTHEPVKICLPRICSCVLRGMSHPLAVPSMAPAHTVATMRKTFANTSTLKLTLGWCAGADRPTSVPKRVSTKEASSGAHVKTKRGMGCSGNSAMNSFIFGITSPSPIETSTVPKTNASAMVNCMTSCAYAAMASSSHVAGKSAMAKM
mmetsp:Transcript_74778/g.173195  ORF Transcript_74778/g.173195 Transcript_74778/m.173195 type:complete len:261 (-) Transcript_74778:320-1102(-)